MRRGPVPGSLEDEGRLLVARLGGRWTGKGGICRCPAHEDRNPSLSVRAGRTALLLHCFAGCETAAILKALRARGEPLRSRSVGTGGPGGHGADSASVLAARLWRDASPVEGSPAERYLARRGLAVASGELRYHRRAPCGASPLTEFRPALVAAVRDETGLVAVHRSFLDTAGNRLAAIESPRRGLGPYGAGAVRLGGTASRLGLAEGLETALSATELFGLPCWATLGTERFRRVALPPQVRELVLFLDNDSGGRRAEALARAAFAHLPLEARYPRQAGADWNDVLMVRPSRDG